MGDKTQATALKFLHIADVHLDTPFRGLSPELSDERRIGLRQSFVEMMEYVRGAGINYVLVSGDLFDTECATGGTAELIIREFRACPNTKFIIAPGKHDAYENNPVYASGRLPDNCFVFESEKIDRFDFEEDKVVKEFLGKKQEPYPFLDLEHPITVGAYMNEPDLINNRYQLHLAMEEVDKVIPKLFSAFGE